MSIRSRDLPLWSAAVVLILLGSALIGLPGVVHLSGALHDFSVDLGAAVLIAGLLAVSVDRWFKRSLLRDAFKELFGYMLPEDLRAELSWIYETKLLCDRHDLILTLTPTDDDALLTLHMESQRQVRNVISDMTPWRPIFAVDEGFYEGRPSRMISLRCTQGGETIEGELVPPGDPFLVAMQSPRELRLKRAESVTVVAEAEETRRTSDAFFLNVVVATTNPRITVHAPENIAWKVMFGHRQQGQVRAIGPNTRELPGTLLRGQVVQVRWWPNPTPPAPPHAPDSVRPSTETGS